MECKYCGRDGFEGTKGLATHRRYNKSCFEKWALERKEEDNKRTKVECRLCGQLLRNISNTHLKKHSITQQQYKILFPDSPLFSEGLLKYQRDKREKTICEKYTKEERKFFNGQKSVLSKIDKYKMPFSDICKQAIEKATKKDPLKYQKIHEETGKKIKKFHEKFSYKEKEIFNKKKLSRRKQTNLDKYGTTFPQSLEYIKNKVKQTKKEKYGDENYTNLAKGKETLFKNYGKYSLFFPRFSLNSQILFSMIKDNIKDIECFYATNGTPDSNNEFQVLVTDSYTCFLDFYIPSIKKWIEFDEKHHYASKALKNDTKREKIIFKKIDGIQLLRVDEKLFLQDPQEALKRCLDFINN